MSRFWSAVVHGLTPYVPGEQPKLDNLVKLNTNEHPYGPSPRALEAIRAATGDGLRLYPDPNADALKAALARHHGVRPEHTPSQGGHKMSKAPRRALGGGLENLRTAGWPAPGRRNPGPRCCGTGQW